MSKVMIIDDDRTMVSLLKMLLEMEGYEVVHAAQSEAIFSGVRSEKPDIVLMDVFLPGLDGMEVLTQLRSAPDSARLRVVMTSGMDLTEQCLAAGADDFLLKPFAPEQLIDILKKNLGADGSFNEGPPPGSES